MTGENGPRFGASHSIKINSFAIPCLRLKRYEQLWLRVGTSDTPTPLLLLFGAFVYSRREVLCLGIPTAGHKRVTAREYPSHRTPWHVTVAVQPLIDRHKDGPALWQARPACLLPFKIFGLNVLDAHDRQEPAFRGTAYEYPALREWRWPVKAALEVNAPCLFYVASRIIQRLRYCEW